MGKTLSEHATYELERAGLFNDPDPEARQIAIDTMALVRRFERQNHTAKSARYVIDFISSLCSLVPITAISDNPDEWEKYELEKTNTETKEVEKQAMWNSRRCPSIFSEDGGKTWFDQATGEKGQSVNDVKWLKDRDEAQSKRREAMKQAGEGSKTDDAVDSIAPEGPRDIVKEAVKEVVKETPKKKK